MDREALTHVCCNENEIVLAKRSDHETADIDTQPQAYRYQYDQYTGQYDEPIWLEVEVIDLQGSPIGLGHVGAAVHAEQLARCQLEGLFSLRHQRKCSSGADEKKGRTECDRQRTKERLRTKECGGFVLI